jgi:acetylornithine/N-succinyldiaminopimelate aminotransferase
MPLFDVYPLYDIHLEKGRGSWVYDHKGKKYLDFYGGHAVISIGHSHPHYVKTIKKQLNKLGYYSNSVHLDIQEELANLLGKLSGYPDYNLFLCSSGAEAIENALKLASFVTGRKTVIAMQGAFHGRTAGAVAVTDNKKIKAPVNDDSNVVFVPMNDIAALTNAMKDHEACAVIIEPIQGVNGIYGAEPAYLQAVQLLCKQHGTMFIADEVQCGYGRTGKFFAHQYAGVKPDIITMAKGMGNGFPVGGVLIHPNIKPWHGMLGTTFGGSPLACAAAIAVLEVIEKEGLIAQAEVMGQHLIEKALELKKIKEVRGTGLMLGVEFNFPIKDIRNTIALKEHVLTGNASNPNTLRLLPALNIRAKEADKAIRAIKKVLK